MTYLILILAYHFYQFVLMGKRVPIIFDINQRVGYFATLFISTTVLALEIYLIITYYANM